MHSVRSTRLLLEENWIDKVVFRSISILSLRLLYAHANWTNTRRLYQVGYLAHFSKHVLHLISLIDIVWGLLVTWYRHATIIRMSLHRSGGLHAPSASTWHTLVSSIKHTTSVWLDWYVSPFRWYRSGRLLTYNVSEYDVIDNSLMWGKAFTVDTRRLRLWPLRTREGANRFHFYVI